MQLKQHKENGLRRLLKSNKKLFKNICLFILFAGLFSGLWMGNNYASRKGYAGLWDLMTTVIANYKNSLDAKVEKISIEISDKDFKKLEKKRSQALERGVIINDIDGEYVPALINYNGEKIKVKLRLKGHMTDHLQDNKWSFRIKIKEKNETLMGMKRFSIQHPGTRGYIYEWIYHELMKREDIIALRYKFINVEVNGRDWGIYALEENFEDELIENNKRLKGPVLRLNPDLYWIRRYNYMTRTNSFDEFASYYSANPEAYREDKVLSDTVQKQYYLKAIALIEGLREGKIAVENAFDIPRLAKFHAIIDLVGGTHSIDWSDIKYYYNPVTGKLEPVAYESFTMLQSRDLSTQYKYVSIDSVQNYKDWHSMIFSNKYFFREYMKNIERVTKPEYLNAFFDSSNEALKANLAIIHQEFPYKKFDKQNYYGRQKMISKILNSPKSIHAYLYKADANSIIIQIGNIDALPVEIHSISVDNQHIKSTSEIIIPSKEFEKHVTFKQYLFNRGGGISLDKINLDSLKVIYSILGSSELKECKIFPFPHTDAKFISEDLKNKTGNLRDFAFLSVNKETSIIQIKAGSYILDQDLIIPSGYKVLVDSGVSLDLKNKSKVISYSPVLFAGSDDQQIIISSSDSTGQGIILIQTKIVSRFNGVIFKNLPVVHDKQWPRTGSLTFYEAPVEFSNCSFFNSKAEDAISIIRSDFIFKECLFRKMNNDALDCDFSDGSVSNCVFEFCNENAFDLTEGKINIEAVYINNSGNKAINLKAGSQLKGSNISIKNSNIAFSAEDFSIADLEKIKIENSSVGLFAKNKSSGGSPQIKIKGLEIKNVIRKYIREKKTIIVVDGVYFNEEVENAETTIKIEGKKQK